MLPRPNQVISIEHDSIPQINYAPATLSVSAEELSIAESFYYLSSNDEQVHAFYYPPVNSSFGRDNELPPVIAMCHGGPTGATDCGLNPGSILDQPRLRRGGHQLPG